MREFWKSFVGVIVGGIMTFAATALASTFGYWNKNRELDIRMVDVALTILSAKDEATNSRYAKKYAIDLLEHYGGQAISNKDDWANENKSLPVGKWPSVPTAMKYNWYSNSDLFHDVPDISVIPDATKLPNFGTNNTIDWEKFFKEYSKSGNTNSSSAVPTTP